jgi:hypothetical protein
MSPSTGIPTTRRFKAIYVAITALFLVAAFGTAVAAAVGAVAAGVWAIAAACLAMGAVMTVASKHMKAPPRSTRPRSRPDQGVNRTT